MQIDETIYNSLLTSIQIIKIWQHESQKKREWSAQANPIDTDKLEDVKKHMYYCKLTRK